MFATILLLWQKPAENLVCTGTLLGDTQLNLIALILISSIKVLKQVKEMVEYWQRIF